MKDTSNIILLAAGGTGGHVFPAEALASELRVRGWQPQLVTDSRFEGFKTAVKAAEDGTLPVHTIRTATIGGSFLRKLKGILGVLQGLQDSRKLLDQLQPAAVVGFGGYPSFPTTFVAARRHIPSIIHEQNAILGRANRVLARFVDKIACSFPSTKGVPEADQEKTVVTGNPVRPAVRALRHISYPRLQEGGMLRLMVVGGSLGATVFSRVVPEALAALPENLRKRIRVDQQCRAADIDAVRARYQELGVQADLATFFHDIPARLAAAHVVIARAGASTVAELTAAGRPAVLVPYPHALDDHQTTNAMALEEVGGGWLMPEEGFTPEALRHRIEHILNLPRSLYDAAAHAREIAQLEAASHLADLVEATIGRTHTHHQDPEPHGKEEAA
jgi:UDP-N-acetylglucosamine--N-acetylmuramyl-(pentapeptide) pyrophosphoryl-undecaprenol N-acetylglucosamine transferase